MRLLLIIILFSGIFSLAECGSVKDTTKIDEELKIKLRWSKAYPDDTPQQAEIGINWILSYLGAELDSTEFANGVNWLSDDILELNLSTAGFNQRAMTALGVIVDSLKSSEEYQLMHGVDLGRFYLLTFNSSWHYYEITGVEKTFDKFLEKYEFNDAINFYKNESGIAYGDRVVFLGSNDSILSKMAFYALEGKGSILKNNFKAHDYEVYDYMPNGQPRFAIYNQKGNLKEAADAKLGKGGKPAKCMWCHESGIQPSFKRKLNKKLKGFNNEIYARREKLSNIQNNLNTTIEFDSVMHHIFGEIPFASFMECTAEQIQSEYQIQKKSLSIYIDSLKCKVTPHYPMFDCYYDREKIEELQPYKGLAYPGHMWEESDYEPNFFK